jgi:hypothetical protein
VTEPRRVAHRPRRWLTFALLLIVLIGAVVAEQRVPPAERPPQTLDVGAPVAAPPGALSSTWFCAGATAEKNGRADGMIWIANANDVAVDAKITFVPVAGAGEAKVIETSVAANSRRFLRHGEHVTAPFAAAMVEVDGGDVAVEHSINGAAGEDHAPCASKASDEWHFADGSTARDATLLLALFNPFPDDAVAELSFTHEEGRATPSVYQGLVVPARGLIVVDVGAEVRRREQVSSTVRVRSGRLVVDRIQLRTERPKRGAALNLGAPSGGDVWYFPEGAKAEGIAERVVVYNPGEREALVDVEFTLDEGAIEPFELSVPPRDRAVLDVSAEERVPAGAHAITVRSVNGEGVVAERWIEANGSGRLGLGVTSGSPITSERWLFAFGATNASNDEWIVVHNVNAEDVEVDVVALAAGRLLPIQNLQNLEVPAGSRKPIRLGDHVKRDDLPLLVTATGPVVVDRDLYRVGILGISTSIGVALR